MFINRCTFQNITNNGNQLGQGILSFASEDEGAQFTVTNNKFINCTGNQTGSIYAELLTDKYNFTNNQFSGNSLIQSDQRGCDAYILFNVTPPGWTQSNIQSQITSLLKWSKSTNIDSIRYQTPLIQEYISLTKEYYISGSLTSDCICDPNCNTYPLSVCERDWLCTFDFIHQSTSVCPCLPTDDLRIIYGLCVLYCVIGSLSSDCVCDSNSTSYPPDECQKDQSCTFDLIVQNHTYCPCFLTGDPRAGKGEYPAYCVKGSLNSDCMCDSGSSNYPSATCEKDKKCAFDLANQTQATCSCLETGDPRSDSKCKKTDPIDEEKDGTIKKEGQEQQDEKSQDKSTSSNMIWIIFVVIGVLLIVAVISIIMFIVIRSKNKKNSVENDQTKSPEKSNQEGTKKKDSKRKKEKKKSESKKEKKESKSKIKNESLKKKERSNKKRSKTKSKIHSKKVDVDDSSESESNSEEQKKKDSHTNKDDNKKSNSRKRKKKKTNDEDSDSSSESSSSSSSITKQSYQSSSYSTIVSPPPFISKSLQHSYSSDYSIQSFSEKEYEVLNDISNVSLNSNVQKSDDLEDNKLSQVGSESVNPELEKYDEFQLTQNTNSSTKSKNKSEYGSIIVKYKDA
ncbi:MAG: hypothetical protein EZS28_011260 [Streblomastix strix]|uniref:Uncharacterized protein n=1 Tax=Streblomastix strix TaxID=222440 RepID=A0A5J4WES8_9EUKA|nr:MAG: hypothetical protein EZS28_011260 [Streblomastix strix]